MSFRLTRDEYVPTTEDRCSHILSMIEDIESAVATTSLERLRGDERMRLALERMFEIIGVASSHVPIELKDVNRNVDWKTISDLDKQLMDPLVRIDAELLWHVAANLGPLKSFARAMSAHN